MVDSIMNTLKYRDKQLIKMYYLEKKDMPIILSILKREEDTSVYNSIARLIKQMDEIYQSE